MASSTIGKFKVGRQLGSGNQGTVYLCADTDLQRKVAIKLLDKSVPEAVQRGEGQAMSKLQHSNIVSIYEAGEHRGTPYLVFEYVEGELLGELIRGKKLDLTRSLDVFKGILEGVSRAHLAGIVHRDLKPANIIINGEQIPKIMDFGIARLLAGGRERDQQLIGSPRYMAPEYISKGEVSPSNDVFALGLILDEMLTGMPVFNGRTQQMVFDEILKVTPQPPSHFNKAVDERLDRFVLKALEKDPALRYNDATEMLQAFNALRNPGAGDGPDPESANATIEFLLRRMKRKSDFPALSQSVRSINAMAQASDKDVGHLAGVIVKDFALTNKILKVVNSAFYGRFSGRIGTVSRAVVVLGIQAIRSLAASLIFFEHIQDKAQAEQLRELVSSAMFSATLASHLAKETQQRDVEDFFLSTMLRDLGRILTAFYLPDEAREIDRLIQQEELEPVTAQHQVLGVSYERIGIEVAEQWNFPKDLVMSMQPWKVGDKPVSRVDQRRLMAQFSTQTTRVMMEKGLQDKAAVDSLIRTYARGLGLNARTLERVAGEALDEFREISRALATDISQPFVKKLSNGVEEEEAGAARTNNDGLAETRILNGRDQADELEQTQKLEVRQPSSEEAEALLMEGLQEVTGLLVGEYSVSEVFNVVLETMYRSLGFHRVVLALHNRKTGEMAGRLGFGQEVDSFVEQFRFPERYSVDVFHGAMKNAVDVYIADTAEEKIQSDIPAWYKKISSAGSFLLFPLVINKRPIGLIYADHAKANGVHIDKKKLNLLKSLRNQIVLAVRS
jgi:serine/threonine protein kinase